MLRRLQAYDGGTQIRATSRASDGMTPWQIAGGWPRQKSGSADEHTVTLVACE